MNQNEATEFLKNYQLIASLRSELPTKLRGDEIDRYFADLLRSGKFTAEELEQAHETREALGDEIDTIRHLADRLISTLPTEWHTQLQNIPVGTLPDLKLNAETIQAPSGEPIIVIASGLSTMLFEAAAWCAGATELPGAPAEVAITDATRNIFQWTVFFVTRSKKWLPKQVFRSKFPVRRNLIGGLWTNALNFVLGHEYGHAILRHLDHPSCKTLNISDIDSSPLLVYYFSHQMEFEADSKGVEVALAFSKSIHNGWVGAGASGTELALQTLRLKGELFPHRAERSTHPPVEERLDLFHRTLRTEYGNAIVDNLHQLERYFDMTATIGRQILDDIRN